MNLRNEPSHLDSMLS